MPETRTKLIDSLPRGCEIPPEHTKLGVIQQKPLIQIMVPRGSHGVRVGLGFPEGIALALEGGELVGHFLLILGNGAWFGRSQEAKGSHDVFVVGDASNVGLENKEVFFSFSTIFYFILTNDNS